MKRNLLIAIITILSFNHSYAQLPNGSIAPDFTVVDLDGVSHTLYDYLDNGQTVFLDFSAIWCPPCWSYHQSHALKNVYVDHGPSGYPGVSASTTNDVMVFFIEGQGGSLAELNGGGSSMGDWVTGTPYPIIGTFSGSGNTTAIASLYQTPYWPTVYQICPDRTITLIGQAQGLYSMVASCLPPPSKNNDARSFMNNSPSAGCSSIEPVISIQNYGLNNLTEVIIDVALNGVSQYTTTFNQMWSNATNSYVPLDLATLELTDVLLDPITNLSNGDLVTIDVSMPNGVNDTDPLNNQTISFAVELGFDNAYWDGALDITVAGGPQNAWEIRKVSNGQKIASGFGGETNATNFLPLTFNECYTLRSVNGNGLLYTVYDAMGQLILEGTPTSVDDFDNFTTGDEVWTPKSWNCNGTICSDPGDGTGQYSTLLDCKDNSACITSVDERNVDFHIYPNPVTNVLLIEGHYNTIIISDIFGKEVLVSDYQSTIDVSSLSDGVYFIALKDGELSAVKKIVVSN